MNLTAPVRGMVRSLLEAISPNSNEIETANRVTDSLNLEVERLQESLAELELAYDSLGWKEFGSLGERSWNFKRESLKKMMDLSRRIYLMNPLMKRTVEVETLYVFAQGFTLKAVHPVVQQVVDDFFNHPKNQSLTSTLAWMQTSDDQQITGNTFLCMVSSEDKGTCRGRTIPVDEISQIITDPNDGKCVWFYKRVWLDHNGITNTRLYPDSNYNPSEEDRADKVRYQGDLYDVDWDMPIYHLKTGGLKDMLFGCPQYLSIFQWVVAYKTMLENWATIIQAYARMAMKVTGLQGKSGIAASKSKLNTALTGGKIKDTNPSSNTASWFLASGNADLSAIKTAGSTTSAEEGRPLRLMAAAGAGLPDTFFGDSDAGNHATSETLDRPTELKMVSRQKIWMMFILGIIDKVILTSARFGKLKSLGAVVEEEIDEFDDTISYSIKMPSNTDEKGGEVGQPISLFVECKFPSILERNAVDRVRSVVTAATLNGSPVDGVIPDRALICEMLLEALQVENIPEVMKKLYPKGPELQGYVTPEDRLQVDKDEADAKKRLADAANKQADAADFNAHKPAPKPSVSGGAPAVSNK